VSVESSGLPVGFRVAADPNTRVYRGGTLLVGGVPRRALRLTDHGARVAAELLAGAPVTDDVGAALARRLVDTNFAHPRPPDGEDVGLALSSICQVVIPAFGAAGLDDCLRALGRELAVHVIDDGSPDAAEVAAAAARAGATFTRMGANRGPASARNIGLRTGSTPYVAFVDSDAVATVADIGLLIAHLADPRVGAVAPRVRPVDAGKPAATLARYANARSPLDLGDGPASVRPTGRIGHVPTTVLVVRRDAAIAVGGFDESMRFGEDVDLVWRLASAGWTVRYQPDVSVRHAEPKTWRAWLARRAGYGTSAGPLALRHPQVAGALTAPGLPTTAVLLLLARRLWAANAVAGLAMTLLWRRWHRTTVPAHDAWRAAVDGTAASVAGSSRWLTQIWWPLLLVPRLRVRVIVIRSAVAVLDWARVRPDVDPARWTLAEVADDVAYGLGVWWGCLASRSWRPLVPRLTHLNRPVPATSGVTSRVLADVERTG
jgi:mycofactocin system glycosyltransferase